MTVVNMLQRQIERRAELICQSRNQNLPVDMGKSSFESIEQGVHFLQHHCKLDSSRCEYISAVAKLVWEEESCQWALYVPADEEEEGKWLPYPYLSKSSDLTAMAREVEKDPKSVFWQ